MSMIAAALLLLILPIGGICVAQDTTTTGTFEYVGIGAEVGMTFGNCSSEPFPTMSIALMDDFSLTAATSSVRLNIRLMAFVGFSNYGAALALRYTFRRGAYVSLGYCIKDVSDPFAVNSTSGHCTESASGLLQYSYALASVGLDFTHLLLELEAHRQLQAGNYEYSRLDSRDFGFERYSGPGKPLLSILLRVSYKIPI